MIELSVVDQILLSFTSCVFKCIDDQIIDWEGSWCQGNNYKFNVIVRAEFMVVMFWWC